MQAERSACGALIGHTTTAAHVCREIRLDCHGRLTVGEVLRGFNNTTELWEEWRVDKVSEDWQETVLRRLS